MGPAVLNVITPCFRKEPKKGVLDFIVLHVAFARRKNMVAEFRKKGGVKLSFIKFGNLNKISIEVETY